MARLTEEQKEEIVNRWRCGESQNSLAKRFSRECSIATINRLCKGVAQDNAEIVNAQVEINQQLSQKCNSERNTITEIVDERTRHLLFFQDSAMKNQKIANDKIEEKAQKVGEDGLTLNDLNAHSQITSRNKETVLGKSPDTQVNVQNNVTTGLSIAFDE